MDGGSCEPALHNTATTPHLPPQTLSRLIWPMIPTLKRVKRVKDGDKLTDMAVKGERLSLANTYFRRANSLLNYRRNSPGWYDKEAEKQGKASADDGVAT